MGNRTSLGNEQYAVNKYIGTAYDHVKNVSENIEDVKTVAEALGDDFPEDGLDTLVENIDNINTVVDNLADVNTAADNILEIIEVADNIDAVLDAPNQAELAHKWAQEAEDVEVLPNEYSAYHYSKKSEEQAVIATDAADSIGRYQGLWPDTGGSALKGDTYQTQVSGVPTGQYFTALQNTMADPIGDDVNWRAVVSKQWVGDNFSNMNLLSNHNFLIQTPDDSQPLPSATPTSYPPGYQIFSGVFANETTGITNLTYINGRVSFSGGDLYFTVPNTGGVERLTEFAASVADFDGKPRTRGVSFALVGDEYRVAVGIDALEDAGTTLTPLGSVKFEQGSVATRHDLQSAKCQSYTFNTVAEMVANGAPVGSKVQWLGYHSANDGGGNKGIVKYGPHTEDGGITFSIDANTYIEVDTAEGISVLQFGLIPSDHSTTARAQAAYNSGISKIKWPKRNYVIDAVLNGLNGILVKSNTLTIIEAGSTLTAFAPEANEYAILDAIGASNVFFYVEGVEFIGDRDTHTGVTGEQGFGIRIGECDRYVIRGGTYRDFWGDGLFVGKFGAPGNPPSTNGYIRGVVCDNNRRQGMSIVVANGLVVEDSKFLNSNGTSPESGVDSEPNANDLPNYDVTFRNCEFSGANGGFNAPFSDGTSDFHFYKCTFHGTANRSLGGDALQFRSDGLHGISTFNECVFNGVVREAENAIFRNCNFTAGDEYLQTVWVFSCVNNTVVKLIDCTITAKGEKRPMHEGGSTLPTTAKKFVRTRFIKQGDQGALFAVNHSSGYSTYTDCELIHQGAAPASDFYFNGTIDGVELVIESITGDSFFTVGGQSGRYSTVYPIRGTGSPEGVVLAPVGSQFMDSAGGAGNVRFLKESGTGNTGWVAA